MKHLRHFILSLCVMLFFVGNAAAKDPANKSSFHPCPVNASAGKRAQVRTTTIRKKGKPAQIKKTKTVKTKTVKQKTVKTKAVQQKQTKTKVAKQPKQKKSVSTSKTMKVPKGKSKSTGRSKGRQAQSVF